MTSSSAASVGRDTAAVTDPADRLRQPVGAYRLQHVVDGLQVEGIDRVLVVRRDEHDLRRYGEARQHPSNVDAGQARHADVEEQCVDRALP